MMATEYRDARDKDQDDSRDLRQTEGPNPDVRDLRREGDDRDVRLAGDARDVRTLVDLPDSSWVRNAPASIVAGAYALLGLSLCLEPSKWDRTPAYAILLDLAPQQVWGLILLGVAVLLGSAAWLIRNRIMTRIAHLVAILFTAGWMFAFFVRWATDIKESTTPMNAVMWGLALSVIVFSLRSMERYWASIPRVGETE